MEIKTLTVTQKGQIQMTVPEQFRDTGKVIAITDKDEIRIRRLDVSSDSWKMSESAFKDWLSPEEDEAWKDL